MKTKAAKRNARKPTKHPWPKLAAPRVRTKTFRDGSALILDQHGGTFGLIEARTPYRVRKGAKSQPLARRHG